MNGNEPILKTMRNMKNTTHYLRTEKMLIIILFIIADLLSPDVSIPAWLYLLTILVALANI